MIFSFDVAFSTHDLLQLGVAEVDWHRVVVEASTRDEAALLACQMVSCHSMCTGIYDRI